MAYGFNEDRSKAEIGIGRSYDTVAKMKSDISLEDGDICITSCKDLPDDGLGHVYKIVSSIDDTMLPNAMKNRGFILFQLDNGLYALQQDCNHGDKIQAADFQTIANLTRTAGTYVSQEGFFTYGTPNYDQKAYWDNSCISCSVLSALLTMGIPFEQSPYCNTSNYNLFSIEFAGYGYPLFLTNSDYKPGSAYLAEKAALDGFGFYPERDWSNVKPGDILFFRNSDNSNSQGWLHIAHCEIFIGFCSNNSRKAMSNEDIIVASAGFTSGEPVRFYHRSLDSVNGQKLVYCARYPLGTSMTSVAPGNQIYQNSNTRTVEVANVKHNTYSMMHVVAEIMTDQTNNVPTVKVVYGSGGSKIYTLYQSKENQIWSFMDIIKSDSNVFWIETTNCLILRANYAVDNLTQLGPINYLYDPGSTTPDEFLETLSAMYPGIVNTKGGSNVVNMPIRLSSTDLLNGSNGTFQLMKLNSKKTFTLERIAETADIHFAYRFIYDEDNETWTKYAYQETFTEV